LVVTSKSALNGYVVVPVPGYRTRSALTGWGWVALCDKTKSEHRMISGSLCAAPIPPPRRADGANEFVAQRFTFAFIRNGLRWGRCWGTKSGSIRSGFSINDLTSVHGGVRLRLSLCSRSARPSYFT